MKGLGLTGAGLGVAAAAAPAIHDLDELLSSTTAGVKRPWWISERELDDPTTEVDWSMLKRYDHKLVNPSTIARPAVGSDRYSELQAQGRALRDSQQYSAKGQMHRDRALRDGSGGGPKVRAARGDWGGPMNTSTPEERGVPKWHGTPEEATRMVRAAMIFFGASAITVGGLNGKHRSLINKSDRTRDIILKDLPAGDPGGRVGDHYEIPDIPLWEIGWQSPMAREPYTTGQSDIWKAANGARYTRRAIVQPATQEFLRALGYMCFAGTGYPITSGAGNAILHGGAEGARATNCAISPIYGSVHGYFELLTDLEMEEERPIDAGIWRFCQSCGRCAEYCPSDSIPTRDVEPSWDVPTSPEAPDIPMTGHIWKKSYWPDRITCNLFCIASKQASAYGCHICAQVCVFNQGQAAIAHSFAKGMVATTGLFNGFFVSMADVFGYGQQDPEAWWDKSLPQFGINSTVYSKDGGYN
jgi:reductive dehalogenase